MNEYTDEEAIAAYDLGHLIATTPDDSSIEVSQLLRPELRASYFAGFDAADFADYPWDKYTGTPA